MSTLFSIFVTVISLGTILGCFLLLVWCLRDKMGVEEGKSMGHAFDGIEEINNPLPKWWTYMFLFFIVTGLVYLLAFPGLGNWKGLLGWQSSNQDVRSLAESKAAVASAKADACRPAKRSPDGAGCTGRRPGGGVRPRTGQG